MASWTSTGSRLKIVSKAKPDLRVVHKITPGTCSEEGLLKETFSFEVGDRLALYNVQTATAEYVKPTLGMAKAMGYAAPLLSKYRQLCLDNNQLRTHRSRMEVMRAYVIVMAALNGEEIPKETPYDVAPRRPDYSRR